MISFIVKLFHALNSNSHPGEIANAVALGIILGFMPKTNLLWYILFLLFMFIRINKGTFLLFTLIGSLVAPALDPFFESVGYSLLMLDRAIPVYEDILRIPFVPLTQFNNTIVLGSLVVGLVLYLPSYGISRLIIWFWRKHIQSSFIKSPFVQAIYKIPFVSKCRLVAMEIYK